jgi:hypothetical protein
MTSRLWLWAATVARAPGLEPGLLHEHVDDEWCSSTRCAICSSPRMHGSAEAVLEPGWPESRPFPVREVLDVIVNEVSWHRHFAERDLDALADRRG